MGHSDASLTEEFKSALFTPLKIGSLTLTHRIVLAPLTRMRASIEGVPNEELASTYYSQRATKGGLLIAEATNISQQATGYAKTPGIYTDAQTDAWKGITQAVKAKGAFFFLQLWHVGRVSHSKLQPNGQLPVAPSPIGLPGIFPDGTGTTTYEIPHELRAENEIPAIIADYRRAAQNAFLAGFDGVEVHAANGYLIDQFLHDGSNHRSDNYGGSIENRSRFLFEVLTAVQQSWKEATGPSSPLAENVGVRLGPFGTFNNMSDSNETELFRYVITKLNDKKLAYIHVIEPRVEGTTTKDETAPAEVVQTLCRLYRGPIISAGGYRPDTANAIVLQAAKADPPQELAVAFGRHFIANPDLPLRILLRAPITHYNRSTFYTPGGVGYTDQPFLDKEVIQAHIQTLHQQYPDNEKLHQDIQNYTES